MQASVYRLTMSHPGDLSELAALFETGRLNPSHVIAVIGKTEGNGGVNDFTRGYFTLAFATLMAGKLKLDIPQVIARIPCILSGGTEGVLTPHYTVFARSPALARPDGKRLAIGVAFSAPMLPEQIGRQAHIDAVAAAVQAAMADAGLDNREDVHFVQVKTPCVTLPRAEAAARRGAQVLTADPGRSMAYARVAGAFGVALALGETTAAAASEAAMFADYEVYSSRASISSGVEIEANEVIILGNSAAWSGDLLVSHAVMQDALDISGVSRALTELGIPALPQVSAQDAQRLRAVFVKCEPARTGTIRGQRHTMLEDTDINAQRHIRGAVGGLVAGVTGDTRLFVSGGAEHQGPDGGGLIAAIAQV